jgi:hypothetical protein
MIWPLKLSPPASPVATLSPKKFKLSQFGDLFFRKQAIFARFWRQLSPFGDFLPQKKSLAATAAATSHCGLWSRVFNSIFSKKN